MATNDSNGSLNEQNIDHCVQLIINDFLRSQLALKGYEWTPIDENGVSHEVLDLSVSLRTKIGDALSGLGRTYLNLYEENFTQMCERLELMPSTAFPTFNSVSNELFIEGIKWSHIVTYLVFGSEFAFYCVQKGFPDSVNQVSHWLALFVSQNLLNWIRDHGGWEGVIEFARETIGQPQGNGQWRFGLKDIICGAAGALGVLTLGLFLTTKS